MIKKLPVLALLLVLTTGCIGPNNAFDSVISWNSRATESKWWNELIFLPMSIVAEFALIGDYLIFNSIEFWGGENPIQEPQPFSPQNEL